MTANFPDTWQRLVVLGAGAIGASVGALLHEAGHSVTLVGRGAHGVALADGVDLRGPGWARRIRVPVASLDSLVITPEDVVLLATMGQHTPAAVAGLDPAVPVVSLQNGVAPLMDLAGRPTLAAMLWVPAERRAPGQIALPGDPDPGAVLLGAWPSGRPPLVDRLVAALRDAGFRAEAEADIAPWIRAKELANLGGVVVALCDDPPAEVVEAARAEARAVWTAAGLPWVEVDALLARIGPLDQLPVDGRERVGGSTRGALSRGEQLETAKLHGHIRGLGAALGIPTPVNDALVTEAERAVREEIGRAHV